jgi:hypothetical protein
LYNNNNNNSNSNKSNSSSNSNSNTKTEKMDDTTTATTMDVDDKRNTPSIDASSSFWLLFHRLILIINALVTSIAILVGAYFTTVCALF